MDDYSRMPSFLRWQPLRLPLGERLFAPPLWATLLTLLVVCLFLGLGRWQLHRAAYKADIIRSYSERAHQAPLAWSALLAKGGAVADYPVAIQGRYDNAHNVLLDNQIRNGVLGYHVLTAFHVDESGDTVLVDRGWVRASLDRRQLPAISAAGASALKGLVALPAATFSVGAENYKTQPIRVLRLDTKALSSEWGLPLQPFLIRLDAGAADGFVRDWAPTQLLGEFGPEKSRGYAFQWFSMAVAVLVVFVVVNLSKITRAKSHEQ